METGRNWTRKSIEELIKNWVDEHKSEFPTDGGDDTASDDENMYTAFNINIVPVPLYTLNGQIWYAPIGINKYFNGCPPYTFTDFITPFWGGTVSDFRQMTKNEVEINVSDTDLRGNERWWHAKLDMPCQEFAYFATFNVEQLNQFKWNTRTAGRMIAMVPPVWLQFYNNVSGWPGKQIRSTWQVDTANKKLYVYDWDEDAMPTQGYNANWYFATGSWSRIEGSGTFSNNTSSFWHSEYQFYLYPLSILSRNTSSPPEHLYRKIQALGLESLDVRVSTLKFPDSAFQNLYPNYKIIHNTYSRLD